MNFIKATILKTPTHNMWKWIITLYLSISVKYQGVYDDVQFSLTQQATDILLYL